jgi:hypothetical protein
MDKIIFNRVARLVHAKMMSGVDVRDGRIAVAAGYRRLFRAILKAILDTNRLGSANRVCAD